MLFIYSHWSMLLDCHQISDVENAAKKLKDYPMRVQKGAQKMVMVGIFTVPFFIMMKLTRLNRLVNKNDFFLGMKWVKG